jgi:hypothetical protein
MLSITVVRTGPLFDGRADRKLKQMGDEIERRVAIVGASMIRSELSRVLRVETPYYRLQNEAQKTPAGWRIWDSNVIYGNWLEGTGSRNFPKTRFKGYATYRRTFAQIEERAQVIGEYTAAEFVKGMN